MPPLPATALPAEGRVSSAWCPTWVCEFGISSFQVRSCPARLPLLLLCTAPHWPWEFHCLGDLPPAWCWGTLCADLPNCGPGQLEGCQFVTVPAAAEFLCPTFGRPGTELGTGLIPQSLCCCYNIVSLLLSCPSSRNPHQPSARSLFFCHGQKPFPSCHMYQQPQSHTANMPKKVFLQGEIYSNNWASIL